MAPGRGWVAGSNNCAIRQEEQPLEMEDSDGMEEKQVDMDELKSSVGGGEVDGELHPRNPRLERPAEDFEDV